MLINLGSPASPSPDDVRDYLDEFLMDPYVMDMPAWLRTVIVRGIICRMRPKNSAHAYQQVWTDEGSPLIALTERLRAKVDEHTDIPVVMAMRYGQPSIGAVIADLAARGVDEVYAIPMYPQYAGATYVTVVDEAMRAIDALGCRMDLHVHPPFFDDTRYLELLARNIGEVVDADDSTVVVLSFHGLPESYIRKADTTGGHDSWSYRANHLDCCRAGDPGFATCYRQQTREVAKYLVDALGLDPDRCKVTYQSRMGQARWLTPDTAHTLEQLGSLGVKVAVASPAFVTDCLETLEELNIRGRDTYLQAGGTDFTLIPCLNDDAGWADLVSTWINDWARS